jgi:hypothetical protein
MDQTREIPIPAEPEVTMSSFLAAMTPMIHI